MDEILTVVAVIFAVGVFGFLAGMMALMRMREIAPGLDRKIAGRLRLTPEKVFGLGGVVVAAGSIAWLFLR